MSHKHGVQVSDGCLYPCLISEFFLFTGLVNAYNTAVSHYPSTCTSCIHNV